MTWTYHLPERYIEQRIKSTIEFRSYIAGRLTHRKGLFDDTRPRSSELEDEEDTKTR